MLPEEFYEADPDKLRQQVKDCYESRLGADHQPVKRQGRLLALIAPHAGFVYSGPVASHAFARLAAEEPPPDVVILLGPKHTGYGALFSISQHDYWQTPLGRVAVDKRLAGSIATGSPMFRLDQDAHRFEHSLEVQLPFLQCLYSQPPAIVPIALHYADFADVKRLAMAIAGATGKDERKIALLVSSDFSHDTPRDEAYRLDAEVIEKILQLDAEGFYRLVTSEDRAVCGLMPIAVLLEMLSGLNVRTELLKYATSMDVIRHDRGVGYAAIAFEENA